MSEPTSNTAVRLSLTGIGFILLGAAIFGFWDLVLKPQAAAKEVKGWQRRSAGKLAHPLAGYSSTAE